MSLPHYKCNPLIHCFFTPNSNPSLPPHSQRTMASPPMDVYTMEEFLEILSIQEQTVFLEIKRKQREAAAAGGGSGGTCSLEDMLEMMALQQKKATFEKKRRERLACPITRRPTVMELFGGLCYSEVPLPPSPPSPVDPAHPTSSTPAATFSVGEGSGSRPGEVREGDDEEERDPNHAAPVPARGRNVGEGSNRSA